MFKVLIGSLITVFLIGCAPSFRYFIDYDIGLKEVERPLSTTEWDIIRVGETGIERLSYEDELLKIVWNPTSTLFSFTITNKTSHLIKVIWDEAVYVDVFGISKRVMREGGRFIDRTNSQVPSPIVRGTKITGSILPIDNVFYFSGPVASTGGWRISPMLPSSGNIKGFDRLKREEEIRGKINTFVGKNIQILLPIQLENVVYNYIFVFSIDGYIIDWPGAEQGRHPRHVEEKYRYEEELK